MKPSNLKVSVKNFGPIREGTVEFKPLTVFIGPNNSGKSYMGILLYSLFKALSVVGDTFPFGRHTVLRDLTDEQVMAMRAWFSHAASTDLSRDDELSENALSVILELVRESFDEQMDSLVQRLPSILIDYFGCDRLDDLIFRGSSNTNTLTVDVRATNDKAAILDIRQRWGEPSSDIQRVTPAVDGSELPGRSVQGWMIEPDEYRFAFAELFMDMWWQALVSKGFPTGNSYYLPAGRSGILQGWQLLTSLAIRTLRGYVGARPIEVPAFTGVAGDFLQELLERVFQTRRSKGSPHLSNVLEILEGEILQGSVQVPTRMTEDPTMYYQSESVRIPIQRSSSMVAELAPLDFWIRNLVQEGDVLIIDEPEAHLHPENQRLIAQVLVRLMNSGVKVICATHSSMILHQISNHILAGSTTDERRHEHGFGEHDIIKPQDVGVYLFKPGTDGVAIENVEIEPEFGIPEDEFVRIADEISEQTYRLIT